MQFIDKLIRTEKKKEIATESSPVDELRRRRAWRGFAASQQNDASSTSPVTISTKNEERIGLFELTPKETEKTIDVVAVHGLQGDAFKTWEHENGSMWLQDFLPADIPDARIMTFGYDSTVAFSRSVAKIEDKALELLNHLSAERFSAASGTSRPIVFVCHSLGGIVVKKALILAHERNSFPEYKDISDNARAIAFLGVPHKGSDSAWWACFGANLLKSASIGTSTNTALISDLEKGAITLANVSKQFVDRTRDMIIYTFYETEKIHGVKVVDERSALIGLANERLFPVNANHRTMCKIPSSTSHQYRTVGRWIANLTKTVLSNAVLPEIASEAQLPSHYDVPNRRIRQFVGREGTIQKIDDAFSLGSGLRIAASCLLPASVTALINIRSLSVNSYKAGRLDIFGVGTDNAVFQKKFDGAWSSWDSLGGIVTGPPIAVSWSPNRLDLFAKGTDNALFHKWSDGNTWGPSQQNWEGLGGVLASDPVAVAWGPNRLDIFGLGTDNALYHKAWNGQWSDWDGLDGIFTSPPAVTSWAANRLDVFGLGTDNSYYHKAWNGNSWSADWENLGGVFFSEPTAISRGPNIIDLFGIGTDNVLYHKLWDGSRWNGWESLGGLFNSTPAVASWDKDRLDLFGLGTDNQLFHKAWTPSGGWSPSQTDWEARGGVFESRPAVTAWAQNRLDIFGLGLDNQLYHQWWTPAGYGPSATGWEGLGGVLRPYA